MAPENAPDETIALDVSVIEIKDRLLTLDKTEDLVNTSVDINDIILTEFKDQPKPETAITFTLEQVEQMLERVKTKH